MVNQNILPNKVFTKDAKPNSHLKNVLDFTHNIYIRIVQCNGYRWKHTQKATNPPVSHVVILSSPPPIQIGVTIDPLEVFRSHVEYSPYQFLIC